MTIQCVYGMILNKVTAQCGEGEDGMEDNLNLYNTLTKKVERFIPNDRRVTTTRILEISAAILWKMCWKNFCDFPATM